MQKAEQILQAIRGSGEPDDAKVSSPVRRGAVGKGRKRTSLAAYPTHLRVILLDTRNRVLDIVEVYVR